MRVLCHEYNYNYKANKGGGKKRSLCTWNRTFTDCMVFVCLCDFMSQWASFLPPPPLPIQGCHFYVCVCCKSRKKRIHPLKWLNWTYNTYLLFDTGKSGRRRVPSWYQSIFSSPVPAIEQLNIAVPPELTICTCGWICTDKTNLTCKRISTRCSPNWFVALHT